MAAVGNGFAKSGWRWWHSSWVITSLQDELFIFSLWKDKAACWKNVAFGASCAQLSGSRGPWRKEAQAWLGWTRARAQPQPCRPGAGFAQGNHQPWAARGWETLGRRKAGGKVLGGRCRQANRGEKYAKIISLLQLKPCPVHAGGCRGPGDGDEPWTSSFAPQPSLSSHPPTLGALPTPKPGPNRANSEHNPPLLASPFLKPRATSLYHSRLICRS